MAGILSLKSEDEERLHPEAVRWFNARVAEIKYDVPLEELGDNDLDVFLSNGEKIEFNRNKDEITRGLATCLKKQEVSNDTTANAITELSLIKFQVDSLSPMLKLKSLIKYVHQRKIAQTNQELMERTQAEKRNREKAEAEQIRKAEEDRQRAAYAAVNPPFEDAKEYLNKEEHDEFTQATREALEVYLDKGNEYILNFRTHNYSRYLEIINDRKKTEQLKIAATLKAREYNRYLNRETAKIKTMLCPDRKDHAVYFKERISDHRYTGQNFNYFLSNEEVQVFGRAISDIGRRELDTIVPGDVRQFIDSKCRRSYFLLPSAEYNFDSVPCLDFMFEVFAVVETAVCLSPGQKDIDGYIFDLPWKEEDGYSVLLKEPELLGYRYLVLTPEDLGGFIFALSIPLALLKCLLNDQPNGFTISAAVDGRITYKIPKVKGTVTVPDDFAGYLKSIGSISQMVNFGIITQRIADIVNEAETPKLEQRTSFSDNARERSKKALAFQLFSQGKGPSSPEMKALGVHKSTRFKYYNQYLEIHKQ